MPGAEGCRSESEDGVERVFRHMERVQDGNFKPSFVVEGQVYHRIGALNPLPNESAKFLQIYFIGVQVNR